MNLREIEERVAGVKDAEGGEFLFELLRAYGIPKASITRLRTGSYNRSKQEGEYLWRDKVYFRSLDCPDEELYAAVDTAKAEERVWKAPVSRSTPSESHGFVFAGTVAAMDDASRSEPVGREEGGVGPAPFSSRQRSAKRAGGTIPSAECGCSVL